MRKNYFGTVVKICIQVVKLFEINISIFFDEINNFYFQQAPDMNLLEGRR